MARPTYEDLLALSYDDLVLLSQEVADEIHRRDDVVRLPETIEEMTQRFVDRGGDKMKLKEPKAYEPKPPKPPKPPKDEKPPK